jgi:anti-anti-sigma regulatory factor
VAAIGDAPAVSVRALRPPREPDALVLVVSGSIGRASIASLCRRAQALIAASDAERVYLDVSELATADAVAVEALARLKLTVRRLGCRMCVRAAPPELASVVSFMGLADVLFVEGQRKTEQRKELRGVQKEADPGDL